MQSTALAFLLVILTALAASTASAQASVVASAYSPADGRAAVEAALAQGGAGGVHLAASVAKALNLPLSKAQKQQVCDTVKPLVTAKGESVAFPACGMASIANAEGGCGFDVSQDVAERLAAEAAESKAFVSLYVAVNAIIDAGLAGRYAAQVNQAARVIASLVQQDGTFGLSADVAQPVTQGTPFTGGLGLRVLGRAYALAGTTDDTKVAIKDAVKVAELVELAGNSKTTVAFPPSSSTLGASTISAAGLIMLGIAELPAELVDGSGVDTRAFAARVATFLAEHKSARQPMDAFFVAHGLHAAAKLNPSSPIAVAVADDQQSLLVTNVVGAALSAADQPQIKVKKAVVVGDKDAGGEAVVTDVALQAPAYSLSGVMSKLSAAAGVYKLHLRVSTGGESVKTTRVLKVTTTCKGKDARVSAGGDQQVDLKYPTKSTRGALATEKTTKAIKVLFNIDTDIEPRQLFVQLQHSESKRVTSFIATKRAAKNNKSFKYGVAISLASRDVLESLSGPGVYAVSVLIGDALLESAVSWPLVDVDLSWLPVPALETQQQLERGSVEEVYRAPRPEIRHTFGASESRPNAFFSLIFSIATIAPFVLLILYLLASGPKLALPSSGALSNLVFQATLAAILGLYTLYWLQLNVFQALSGLAMLAPIAILSGHRALRALAKQDKQ